MDEFRRPTLNTVLWLNDLVNGHVGDAATLDGQLPAYYATAAHTHSGTYLTGTDIGVWVPVSYSGAYFGAASGVWTVDSGMYTTFRYSLDNKRMVLSWQIDGSSISLTTASLTILIPASKLPATKATGWHAYMTAAGGWDMGSVEAVTSVSTLTLYTRTRANWPNETYTIHTHGQMTLEVA